MGHHRRIRLQRGADRLCQDGLLDLAAQAPYEIGVWDLSLVEFLQCRLGDREAQAFIDRIRTRIKPIERNPGAFVYRATGQMGGYEINMPVSEIWLGVCDRSGETACGASNLLALRIAWPLEEARERLRRFRHNGIDYTIEQRDEDSRSTLRPLLIADEKNPKTSLLFCDAGVL